MASGDANYWQWSDDEMFLYETYEFGSNLRYFELRTIPGVTPLPQASILQGYGSPDTVRARLDQMVIDFYRNGVKALTLDTSIFASVPFHTNARIYINNNTLVFQIFWTSATVLMPAFGVPTRPPALRHVATPSPTDKTSTTATYARLVSGGVGTPPFPSIGPPPAVRTIPTVDDVFYLKSVNTTAKRYTFAAIANTYNFNLGSVMSIGKTAVDDLDIDIYRRTDTYAEPAKVADITTTDATLDSTSRVYNTGGRAEFDLDFTAATSLIAGLPQVAYSAGATPSYRSQNPFYWVRFPAMAKGFKLGTASLNEPTTAPSQFPPPPSWFVLNNLTFSGFEYFGSRSAPTGYKYTFSYSGLLFPTERRNGIYGRGVPPLLSSLRLSINKTGSHAGTVIADFSKLTFFGSTQAWSSGIKVLPPFGSGLPSGWVSDQAWTRLQSTFFTIWTTNPIDGLIVLADEGHIRSPGYSATVLGGYINTGYTVSAAPPSNAVAIPDSKVYLKSVRSREIIPDSYKGYEYEFETVSGYSITDDSYRRSSGTCLRFNEMAFDIYNGNTKVASFDGRSADFNVGNLETRGFCVLTGDGFIFNLGTLLAGLTVGYTAPSTRPTTDAESGYLWVRFTFAGPKVGAEAGAPGPTVVPIDPDPETPPPTTGGGGTGTGGTTRGGSVSLAPFVTVRPRAISPTVLGSLFGVSSSPLVSKGFRESFLPRLWQNNATEILLANRTGMSPIPNGVAMAGLLPNNRDYVAGTTVMRLGLVQGQTAPTLAAGTLPAGQEFRFQSFPGFPFFVTDEVAYADWSSLIATNIQFSPPMPAEIASAIEDSRDTSDEGEITQGDPDIPIRWLGTGLDFSVSLLALLNTTANNEFEAKVRFTSLRDTLHSLSSDDLAIIPAVGAPQIYAVTDWSYEVYANQPETVTLQLASRV